MSHHRHDSHVYAWQAVVARLSLNPQAHADLDEAVGDCLHCWKMIAKLLSVETVYSLITSLGSVYIDHTTEVTFGPAVDWAQDMLTLTATPPEALDAVDDEDAV